MSGENNITVTSSQDILFWRSLSLTALLLQILDSIFFQFKEKNRWDEMMIDSQTRAQQSKVIKLTSTQSSSIQPSEWTRIPSFPLTPTKTIILLY